MAMSMNDDITSQKLDSSNPVKSFAKAPLISLDQTGRLRRFKRVQAWLKFKKILRGIDFFTSGSILVFTDSHMCFYAYLVVLTMEGFVNAMFTWFARIRAEIYPLVRVFHYEIPPDNLKIW
jgi:hypothetical protein